MSLLSTIFSPQRASGVGRALALSVLLAGTAQAQGLAVVSLLPARNAVAAPRTTAVVVGFSQALADNAATQGALRVFSQQAGGRKAGTATVSGTTLRFAPSTAFRPGETVQATVTSAAQGSGGQALASPQVFEFTTATSPSPGAFGGGSDFPLGAAATVGLSRPVLGDVNGDGNLDLLVVGDGTVRVYPNTGAGSFGQSYSVSVGAGSLRAVLGDLDDDGDLDLLTLNATPGVGTVSVRLNNGQGSFSGTQEITTMQDPTDLTLGDFDGDGDLDVATTTYFFRRPLARVFYNNGKGFFDGSGASGAILSNGVSLAAGDADNDGDLDLISGKANPGGVNLLRNEGGGYFDLNNPSTATGENPARLLVADVNGDGNLDFVAAALGSQVVNIRFGDGNRATFASGQDIEVAGLADALLGDVDGDGDLDLVATGTTTQVYLNDGRGAFTQGGSVAVGTTPRGAALGDLDGNGTLDLVTINADNTASVRLNQPVASLPLAVVSLLPARNAVAAPRTTAVVVGFSQALADNAATQGALRVFSQQAGGRKAGTATVSGTTLRFAPSTAFRPGETVQATVTSAAQGSGGQALASPQVFEFTTATSPSPGAFGGGSDPAVGINPQGVAAGDVDGDGDLDLLTANNLSGSVADGTVSVRLNDGAGNFTNGPEVPVGRGPYSVALGDVDGDGDLDFVTANSSSTTVSVRLNNGAGTFSGSQEVGVGTTPHGVALRDVDGDGDLDLLASNYTTPGSSATSTVSVRLNDGKGIFGGGSEVSVGLRPLGLALGDIDNDGDLDLVVANSFSVSGSYSVSVRRNDGQGSFGGSQEAAVGGPPQTVVLGDVDGDGDLDLLTDNTGGYGTVSVRLNDGTGTFGGGQDVGTAVGSGGLALGDVDGDGDLDFVASAYGTTTSTANVGLNNGHGVFSSTQSVTVGAQSTSVVLADLDTNGTLDLAAANYNSNNMSVRLNQLSSPAASTLAYRLDAGGGALATTCGSFAADHYYSAASNAFATTEPIAGTSDPALYQTERYSTNGTLSYAMPVANGQYQVVLHFAEIYWTQAGQRVFDALLEGRKVLDHYDIVQKVGPRTAVTETFLVTVADSVLNLDLRVPYLTGGADQAKLSALEILPVGTSGFRPALASAAATAGASLSTYPNPSPGAFTLVYTAETPQAATLLLTDPLGRVVHEQPVSVQAGANQVAVRAAGLPEGLYRLTLRLANGQHHSQQVVIRP